jgi:hypothetical protein
MEVFDMGRRKTNYKANRYIFSSFESRAEVIKRMKSEKDKIEQDSLFRSVFVKAKGLLKGKNK